VFVLTFSSNLYHLVDIDIDITTIHRHHRYHDCIVIVIIVVITVIIDVIVALSPRHHGIDQVHGLNTPHHITSHHITFPNKSCRFSTIQGPVRVPE
jgi:hypothetical protein